MDKFHVLVEVRRGPLEYEYPPVKLRVRQYCGRSSEEEAVAPLGESSVYIQLETETDLIRFLRPCSQVTKKKRRRKEEEKKRRRRKR